MGLMSVRELNANVSRALAQAESGDDIVLTRHGKPVLRITREGIDDRAEQRREAVEQLKALLAQGVPLGGPATYDDRTGR